MSALDRMLAKVGKTREDLSGRKAGQTKVGRVFRRKGVPKTPELERIAHIPRRRWQDDPDLPGLAKALSDWLRTPEGEQELRVVQAAALQDLHDFGGLFGPIRVGGGKTLISYLAGTVFGAARPLLLVPAKLKRKTLIEFAELRHHWLAHPRLKIMSYEKLSRDGGWAALAEVNPDLIIADEVHKLKNTKAGCTRKVRRWMNEHKDQTKFCAMSGTITTRSLREYHHILLWCLPNHPPLPVHWGVLQDWADAIDVKVDPLHRLAAGALLELANDEEIMQAAFGGSEGTAAARKAFRRRLTETPGVVATEESALGVSLQIEALDVVLGDNMVQAFTTLRSLWETPDGWPISEAMEIWRHARELACGFYYRWDPRPPDDWLAARKAWAAFVRQILGGNRPGIDTEFQVANACRFGKLDRTAYDDWRAIKDTFEPNSVPVWIDDAMLRAAERWLLDRKGLCWVEHVAFGERLEAETGIPYFGAEGCSGSGTFIEDYRGPAILSIAANHEGRNLQHGWNENLLVSCPPNGRIWEQLLGRTHREGQEEDEVGALVALACLEQWTAFEQAREDARYIEHTTGQAQKLVYADICMPTATEIAARGSDPLWSK